VLEKNASNKPRLSMESFAERELLILSYYLLGVRVH